MKKLLWTIVLLGFTTGLLAGNDFATLQQYLDPYSTLEDLVQRLDDPEYAPAADTRLLLLDGTIASITIQVQSEDYFEAVIELASGAWTDTDSIELYRVYVIFPGSEFAPLFASGQDQLEVGSRIITIVQPLGVIDDPVNGNEVLFLEAWYLRPLP